MPFDIDSAWPPRIYFFDAGLRFQCRRCGCCCTGASGTIYVGPEEIRRIAAYLQLPVAGFLSEFAYAFRDSYSIREDADGQCLFYHHGCAIYPVRPLQCSTFPFWFSNVRNRQRWQAAARQCPGIGTGQLFDRDRITALARQTLHL